VNSTPKVGHNIWGVFMLKKKRNKFSVDDKERAVLKIIQGDSTYRSVARDLQTSHRLVSIWVKSYKLYGKPGLSLRNNIKYTGDFKLQLVMEMLNCKLSLHQMSVKHHISHSVIATWKNKYEKYGASALFNDKPRGRPPKMKNQAKKNKESSFLSENCIDKTIHKIYNETLLHSFTLMLDFYCTQLILFLNVFST